MMFSPWRYAFVESAQIVESYTETLKSKAYNQKVDFIFQETSLPIEKVSFTFQIMRLGISRVNSVYKSIAKAPSNKRDRIESPQI
jgi:hypothetical protein